MATALVFLGAGSANRQPVLDYDQLILLDAENLAEGGVKEGYAKVFSALQKHVKTPAVVTEAADHDRPKYSVFSSGIRYEIYGPGVAEGHSWGNATFALFSIVNRQLSGSTHRFYAINGGNDLGGMFLTEGQGACQKVCV